jgi:lysozyme family protein
MKTNLDRWNSARFTRSTQIEARASKIRASRARYEAVAAKTGVPWDVIAVIHYRESTNDFAGVLHNGQKIIGTGRKTTLVPKGRGPFSTWEQAAIDALMNCHPYAGKTKDWSIANTLEVLERYNGLGYRSRGVPSPYLWAGTDQYARGKFVADSKYDPNHVDRQLGVAALLIALRGRDGKAAPVPAAPTVKDSILKRGSKGPFVKELQTSLVALGYDLRVDGDFGAATEAAVKSFQKANGLNPDGWAGPRTIDAVGRALGEKKAAPKIEKAAEETRGKAEREVQKKTGLWQWVTGIFSSGALGLGWLNGMDWQSVIAIGGVVIAFLVVILIMRRQIIGAVKDIRGAVEGNDAMHQPDRKEISDWGKDIERKIGDGS